MSNSNDGKDDKVKSSPGPPQTSKKVETEVCESEDTTKTVKKKYTLKDRMNDIKSGIADIKKTRRDAKAQDCQEKMVGAPTDKQQARPMRYPYTLSAKIAQFPFRYHVDHVWMFKYYFIGIVASFPLFLYLSRKSNSPANVEYWEKRRKALFERHH